MHMCSWGLGGSNVNIEFTFLIILYRDLIKEPGFWQIWSKNAEDTCYTLFLSMPILKFFLKKKKKRVLTKYTPNIPNSALFFFLSLLLSSFASLSSNLVVSPCILLNSSENYIILRFENRFERNKRHYFLSLLANIEKYRRRREREFSY